MTLLPESSLVSSDCIGTPSTARPLEELDDKILAGDCGQITSLIVWHDGATVFEAYYRGTDATTLYPVFSVTKSITSALMGHALANGHIGSVDDPMLSYFPDDRSIQNLDSRKREMTLQDLLTMRAGLDWEEGDGSLDLAVMLGGADWVQFMLDRAMDSDPGDVFVYNSGASILLSYILEAATGLPLAMYADTFLFAPLGIEPTAWEWEETPQGTTNGAWGLSLRAIDMVKLGRLFLQRGMWEGKQVIPADWVEQSTKAWVGEAAFDYGYHWWRFADNHPVVAELAENDIFFARGLGGNLLVVVPHLELVVATTARNLVNSEEFLLALRDYILPTFR